MAHQQQSNNILTAVQFLADHGFDEMSQALQILCNEAMKQERSEYLGAEPYQCSVTRRSSANGFKQKSFQSRLGKLELKVPQTRDGDFYPSALERSVRALKLAIAEMYIQDVSTRKIAKVTTEPCGFNFISTQVSREAKVLNTEHWREFLGSLNQGGLHGVKLIVSDAHEGPTDYARWNALAALLVSFDAKCFQGSFAQTGSR